MRTPALIILLLVLVGCESAPDSNSEHALGHVEPTKAALGVTPPCSLIWCDDMLHAGVAGVLVGSERDTLRFVMPSPLIANRPTTALSRRLSSAEIEAQKAYLDSLRLGRLLPVRIGSLDGRKGDGRPLAIASPEESLLILVIKSSKRPLPSPPRHIHDHGSSAWADWVTRYLEDRRANYAADTLTTLGP